MTTQPAIGQSTGATFKTHPELPAMLSIIVLLNIPVVFHGRAPELMYSTSSVLSGQWWRLFAHPFVHVSWYHFLLDTVAFVVLYHGLRASKMVTRLSYVFWAACGSLVAAIGFAPIIEQIGFCGLSGIGHGLMAISGLEMATSLNQPRLIRRLGVATVAIIVSKCLLELIAGGSAAGFFHFGLMGTPIVVCHTGGVVAGILAFCRLDVRDKRTHDSRASTLLSSNV